MSSALIVYGSTTGNTEYVAGMIEKTLAESGITVNKMNAAQVEPEGLCRGYDLVFFGCSTWGYDTVEMQDDFIELFEAFEQISAQGKPVAVFGCGDSDYPHFCGAVDVIASRLKELGAKVADTLKIDGSPETEDDEIVCWTQEILKQLS